MKQSETGQQSPLTFNEQGTTEVSQQIMDSYNSGYINKEGTEGDLKHPDEYNQIVK